MKFCLLIMLIAFSAQAKVATLFLAHGSMRGCGHQNPSKWEKNFIEALERVKPRLRQDASIAFGMWNTRCFDEEIKKLQYAAQAQGQRLEKIVVRPLFVSSHSLVIEMQKYIFKKREDRPLNIPDVLQTSFEGEIEYGSAIDYNPHVSMILANRFHELIHTAKERGYEKSQMELVIVMHGPMRDEDNAHWMEMGKRYKKDIDYLFSVKKSRVISLRDDADEATRRKATVLLRKAVKGAQDKGRITLVLPLLLSSGGIEAGVLKRLEGLDYIWNGKAILPDLFFDAVLLE